MLNKRKIQQDASDVKNAYRHDRQTRNPVRERAWM